MNYHNDLLTIINNHTDIFVKKWATCILDQINTAGGINILKRTGELNDERINQYLKECT